MSGRDFSGSTEFLLDLAFAPNGQSIAYRRAGEGSEAIWMSTISGEPPVKLAGDGTFQRGPAWSPDGNWIAYFTSKNGKLALMKARVGSSSKPVLIREDAGAYPSWSPHNDWIACLGSGAGLNLVAADGTSVRQAGSGLWYAATFNKNGSQLVGLKRTTEGRFVLAAVHISTGAEQVLSDLGPAPAAFSYASAVGLAPIQEVSLSPDGRTATYSSIEVQSHLWLLKGLSETALPKPGWL